MWYSRISNFSDDSMISVALREKCPNMEFFGFIMFSNIRKVSEQIFQKVERSIFDTRTSIK